tara:strand:- start:44 stop:388 length:345 start_codon:yes stop_codon:yes gene_type:complete
MKAIDELIEKCDIYKDAFKGIGDEYYLEQSKKATTISLTLIIKDLKTLKEQLNANVITDNSKVNENLLEENRQLKAKHKEKLKALRKKHKENISDCYDNALDSFVIFTKQQKRD